jgi:hypothetical protein
MVPWHHWLSKCVRIVSTNFFPNEPVPPVMIMGLPDSILNSLIDKHATGLSN